MKNRPWWGLTFWETVFFAGFLIAWNMLLGFPSGLGWVFAVSGWIIGFLVVRFSMERGG